MENRVFLNRYRLSLGRSGRPVELHRSPFGTTYRAHEMESGREVAIELIAAPSLKSNETELLHDEACALGQINHLNIPALHDFGIEDGQLIYVTEYFDGPTAQAWVLARGPLTPGAVLRIAIQAVGALGAASFHRLSHPALNPANIVFVPGQPAGGDWPAIKLLHWLGSLASLANSGANDEQLESAARYQSPEQQRGEKADFAAAIYSLGSTMWFLLTGIAPAPALASSGDEGVRFGGEKLRGLPKIVRHLLGRMLRSDPAERPHDPVALTAYLQTCLSRVERREKIERRFGVRAVPTPRVVKRKTFPARPLKVLALAAILLALAAGAVLIGPRLGQKRNPPPVTQTDDVFPAIEPNEVPVVMKDSLGRIDESNASSAAPPMAVAHQTLTAVPRGETVAPPAVEATVAELAPPAEGPVEAAQVFDHPTMADASSVLPAGPDAEAADAPPLIAESVEPSAVAIDPNGEEMTATSAAASNEQEHAEATPAVKKRAASAKQTAALAKRSRSLMPAKRRHSTRIAKRAKPLPTLRVGTTPAELVGTTSDGRWILSVSQTGRRIIVPPPPGYDQ